MNLKKRLLLTNLSLLVIPPLLTVVMSIVVFYLSTILSGTSVQYEDFEKAVTIRIEMFNAANTIWRQNPETIAREEFSQYLVVKLADLSAEVIVSKDNELIYATPGLSTADINIDEDDIFKPPASFRPVTMGTTLYALYHHAFFFQDGTPGSLYLLIPTDPPVEMAAAFTFFILSMLLVSGLITNVFYSIRIYKNLASPLVRMNQTVTEISEGNLNLEIIEYGDEEIRQLLRSLDKLRLKLQESVINREQIDENRQALVANISHDLKTPITSIRGYVEGILDGVAQTPEQQQKYLRIIDAKAHLLDKMIDDLVLFSKLELNQVPYHFETIDPAAYLEDCIEEHREGYRQEQIEFKFSNQLSGSCFVSIDQERMKRVLLNLFENAKKYKREEYGVITLVLRDLSDRVIIEISDTGLGIPADSLPYIFDRFYRADSARSMADGSGLGLAIAREIVTDHQGAIWVTSKENEGTTFMISLKKADREET